MELIGIFSILIGFIGFALSISAIKKSNNSKEDTLAQVSYYNYNDASSPEKLSVEEQKLIEYFIQQISNNKVRSCTNI